MRQESVSEIRFTGLQEAHKRSWIQTTTLIQESPICKHPDMMIMVTTLPGIDS